jgi:hypothetical protein
MRGEPILRMDNEFTCGMGGFTDHRPYDAADSALAHQGMPLPEAIRSGLSSRMTLLLPLDVPCMLLTAPSHPFPYPPPKQGIHFPLQGDDHMRYQRVETMRRAQHRVAILGCLGVLEVMQALEKVIGVPLFRGTLILPLNDPSQRFEPFARPQLRKQSLQVSLREISVPAPIRLDAHDALPRRQTLPTRRCPEPTSPTP